MEVRVRERLIGALVLVAVVVLLVPAILKGRAPAPVDEPAAQTRRVEVPVGNTAPAIADELPPDSETPLAGAVLPSPEDRPTEVAPPPRAVPPAAEAEAPPRQVVEPKPGPKPPKAAATGWAVQVAAFSTRAKADQVVADLRKRGYAAFVFEYRASGKVLYRVRVGPEQDKGRAGAIAARLAKDGYQPVVARHP